MTIEDVDLLVIGGGKAGKTLAQDRAKAGMKVAMVERAMIGGTCINVACIPTKALVASARALRAARRGADLGLSGTAGAAIDLDLLRAHKEGVVAELVDINHRQFLDSGMDFVLGEATFVDERTVEVTLNGGGTRRLRGADVVINTGSTPSTPPIPGLAEARALTSDSLLDLDALPASIIVLGGGYIGAEFAQMLATFGVSATVLEGGPQLLGREDPEIAKAVATVFEDEGITVRLDARVSSVERTGTGGIRATLEDGSTVEADELLIAVGRSPVTAGLNLEATGVKLTDKGFIAVDEFLQTSAPHVWAAGDVAGSPQFTHVSWDDSRILKANLDGARRSTRDRLIAYTVFVTPDLGRVGMTEAEARGAGKNIRIVRIPVATIPRARTMRDVTGVWTAIIDIDTDLILGAALFGPEAGEAISVVQMAMLGGMPYTSVRDAVISHPTMGEGLNLLFGQ